MSPIPSTSWKPQNPACAFSPSTDHADVPTWLYTNFTDLIYHDKPIDLYGNGTARRDFTYIDDIIQGIRASIKYTGAPFDIFNLGESVTIELCQVIAEIESVLKKKASINLLPPVPGDMPLTCTDISKAQRLLGYAPTTHFQSGIQKFINWYLQRPNEQSQRIRSANLSASRFGSWVSDGSERTSGRRQK
jgi:nucleoside-diphosphate-sugar epimerase